MHLPVADLASFVGDIKPSVIVLLAITEMTATALLDWLRWMPEVLERGKPVLGYGGRVFEEQSEWRSKLPGIYLNALPEDVLEVLRAAVSDRSPDTSCLVVSSLLVTQHLWQIELVRPESQDN